jgi:hypothetical protein
VGRGAAARRAVPPRRGSLGDARTLRQGADRDAPAGRANGSSTSSMTLRRRGEKRRSSPPLMGGPLALWLPAVEGSRALRTVISHELDPGQPCETDASL